MEPLKISIDVTKIDKTAIYEGKKGKYLSLVVWPNKSGEDEYGNIATVKQDMGADRKGEQVPIIGNAKPLRKRQAQWDSRRSTETSTGFAQTRRAIGRSAEPTVTASTDDEIPF